MGCGVHPSPNSFLSVVPRLQLQAWVVGQCRSTGSDSSLVACSRFAAASASNDMPSMRTFSCRAPCVIKAEAVSKRKACCSATAASRLSRSTTSDLLSGTIVYQWANFNPQGIVGNETRWFSGRELSRDYCCSSGRLHRRELDWVFRWRFGSIDRKQACSRLHKCLSNDETIRLPKQWPVDSNWPTTQA